ncbi:S1C family serine protease [Rubrobacter marinus]|uniref:S1C family serine protease n=1 Tax=Rubrobacter marinus TaxID=2653852 RepID=UPI001D181016|nr:trypsin-like peptidase domain-containing protein [Rubrobacter marinus]
MRTFIVVVFGLAVAFAAVGCTGSDAGQDRARGGRTDVPPSAGAPAEEPAARVASQISPSVVQVNVRAVQDTPLGTQEGEGVGSGVIYRDDGYIVTNDHVVQDAREVSVAFADGTTEEGRVVGGDPFTDLAVIKVDRGDLPAARFGRGNDLVAGQLAVAVGSPSGFQSTVTQGVISGLNREVPAELTGGRQETALVDLIQTDAAISPGNSGGALANRNGEIVGINVAYLPPSQTGAENIGFAIPSDTATSVADQLIDNGKVSTPYLGVSLADVTPEAAERFGISVDSGALVAEVEPGGPADEAGVAPQDVVTAAGSTEVQSSGDLLAALRDYTPGEALQLTVVREGEEREVSVELGERQD